MIIINSQSPFDEVSRKISPKATTLANRTAAIFISFMSVLC